jgi:hypothetical protein
MVIRIACSIILSFSFAFIVVTYATLAIHVVDAATSIREAILRHAFVINIHAKNVLIRGFALFRCAFRISIAASVVLEQCFAAIVMTGFANAMRVVHTTASIRPADPGLALIILVNSDRILVCGLASTAFAIRAVHAVVEITESSVRAALLIDTRANEVFVGSFTMAGRAIYIFLTALIVGKLRFTGIIVTYARSAISVVDATIAVSEADCRFAFVINIRANEVFVGRFAFIRNTMNIILTALVVGKLRLALVIVTYARSAISVVDATMAVSEADCRFALVINIRAEQVFTGRFAFL